MRHVAPHTALASAIRSLSAEKNPGCLVDAQGTFLFVNEAWDRHALHNGGAPKCLGEALIGTRWLDHIQGVGIRIVHAVVRSRPIEEVYEVVHRGAASYCNADGRLTECSCCRRLRDPASPDQWDLVPEVLAQPAPAADQALCGYCAELHIGHEGAR